MNKLIIIFKQLVQIASPSGQEKLISLYLKKWLEKNHFLFKTDKVGNIYAHNQISGQPLLLCAHMDTVQPGENICPIIKNGVIKSSGDTILGADNKAAIAALLSVLEENKINRPLELIFSVKEETGGGIEHFPFAWVKSKLALVFDSANPPGGIVLRSPHIINFYVEVIGKAAHASQPNQGVNALTFTLQLINQLKTGVLEKGETGINIGTIQGGTGINTVPETIKYSGEIRSYDEILFKNHLKKIYQVHQKQLPAKIKFSTDGYCAGYTHQKNNKTIQAIDKIYKSLNLKTQYYQFSGVSDANVLHQHEIVTINLTDGVKYPHTVQEQMSIKDLVQLSKIIKEVIAVL